MIENISYTAMICDMQAHCEITFSEEIFENIPTSCDLNVFFVDILGHFKSIVQNNDIVSSFGIGLLCILLIGELTNLEI